MDYNKTAEVDLHIHSNASDGTFSPKDILALAIELGLKAISITDHDTLEGSRKAMEIGIPDNIHFIPGVEISSAFPPDSGYSGSCHILGYGIKLDNDRLNERLLLLQQARRNRNPGIIRKLNELDIPVSINDLSSEASDNAGRPHIARLLVENGVVGSISEAFDKYLAVGQPAYVEKFRIECTEAINLIKEARGIPVLAHPYLINPCRGTRFENLIRFLISKGLSGIEAFYSEHTHSDQRYFMQIADRFGLLTTGGTDFHGSLKPEIQIGSGTGDFRVPLEVYKILESAIDRCRS